MTATARRAYQLCGLFRARGSTVILGGIHPTVLPQEAIQHADAVVIGEAEGCWGALVDDFRRGRLQQFYRSLYPDLSHAPLPRRDLGIDRTVHKPTDPAVLIELIRELSSQSGPTASTKP
jgi:radical SAM superfamily enzyme YgiQ (UPF0313 family)